MRVLPNRSETGFERHARKDARPRGESTFTACVKRNSSTKVERNLHVCASMARTVSSATDVHTFSLSSDGRLKSAIGGWTEGAATLVLTRGGVPRGFKLDCGWHCSSACLSRLKWCFCFSSCMRSALRK